MALRGQQLKANYLHRADPLQSLANTTSAGSEKFRVYNLCRNEFLFVDVTIVDTSAIPLKTLIEGLGRDLNSWLWLKPYRGLPFAPGSLPFDLIYLDQDNRVIEHVKSDPHPNAMFLRAEPASALVLPPHTVFASQIRPGDQLGFREFEGPRRGGPVGGDASSQGSFRTVRRSGKPETQDQPSARLSTLAQGQNEVESGIRRLGQKRKEESLGMKFLWWLAGGRQTNRRQRLPGLIVHYFTGGAPKAQHIGDISETGFYLLTDERPMVGTIILMSLQTTDGTVARESIAMYSKVVRWGPDGIGFKFVTATPGQRGADKRALHEFLKLLRQA